MFDIGWTELLLIGVVALLVVGPKELPRMLRSVGQHVGRAKSIAREFQRSVEDAAMDADMSELSDARQYLSDMRTMKVSDLASGKEFGGGSLTPPKPKADATTTPQENSVEAPAKAPVAAPAADPAPKAAQPAPSVAETAPAKANASEPKPETKDAG